MHCTKCDAYLKPTALKCTYCGADNSLLLLDAPGCVGRRFSLAEVQEHVRAGRLPPDCHVSRGDGPVTTLTDLLH